MPFIKAPIALGALALVSQVSAHGFVTGVVADGIYYQGYNPSDQYTSPAPVRVGWSDPQNLGNGPILPSQYAGPDIICHLSATPAQGQATVKAGGTVNIQWTTWPTSHHGPVISYLANCNGACSTVDKTTLKFNKFDAAGLINDTPIPGTWASDQLIAFNNSRTVTIPADIAPGNYVLRHEIIALHSAFSTDGTQNYPFCVNLAVTGSGTNALAGGTLGTALYEATDPGIFIDIYSAITSYIIPGPALVT